MFFESSHGRSAPAGGACSSLCFLLGLLSPVLLSVGKQNRVIQMSLQVVAYVGCRVKKTLLRNLLIKPVILGNERVLKAQLIFNFYKLRAVANP